MKPVVVAVAVSLGLHGERLWLAVSLVVVNPSLPVESMLAERPIELNFEFRSSSDFTASRRAGRVAEGHARARFPASDLEGQAEWESSEPETVTRFSSLRDTASPDPERRERVAGAAARDRQIRGGARVEGDRLPEETDEVPLVVLPDDRSRSSFRRSPTVAVLEAPLTSKSFAPIVPPFLKVIVVPLTFRVEPAVIEPFRGS